MAGTIRRGWREEKEGEQVTAEAQIQKKEVIELASVFNQIRIPKVANHRCAIAPNNLLARVNALTKIILCSRLAGD